MEERLVQLKARKKAIEMELGELNVLIQAYENTIKANENNDEEDGE